MSDAIELHRPGSGEFKKRLEAILGGEPGEWLRPALPYSVIAENCSGEAIAMIGIRFDLTARNGKKMSVIHLADTLRNPEKTEFAAGASRFFCAESEYASAVMRAASAAIRGAPEVSRRAVLNLQNLRTMLRVSPSVDCVAWGDGRFDGKDTGGAFERFTKQRAAEETLIAAVLSGELRPEDLQRELNSRDAARRAVAAKLLDALNESGREGMLEWARRHRCRIPLARIGPEKQ